MIHLQPSKTIQAEKPTYYGIMDYKIQQKQSNAMGMHFYWVRDRVKQKHFDVFWKPGVSNLGDYFTSKTPSLMLSLASTFQSQFWCTAQCGNQRGESNNMVIFEYPISVSEDESVIEYSEF